MRVLGVNKQLYNEKVLLYLLDIGVSDGCLVF